MIKTEITIPPELAERLGEAVDALTLALTRSAPLFLGVYNAAQSLGLSDPEPSPGTVEAVQVARAKRQTWKNPRSDQALRRGNFKNRRVS